MALVAIRAVVNVPIHALMVLVRIGLSVAIRALENRVVARDLCGMSRRLRRLRRASCRTRYG